ncbi:dimethylargininase [Streptomyces sulfonofaciens]|uniref:Dimethylargininase n=1 Tax=Streptomyces sulfonofaciens TaxID=68272 RepID=A0A919GQU9_9ACTN|nr:arginine deiminase family protein [Streptomyces sulfonofaciens]GHH88679.1 dimethylargininase [Streptomyces sulfonofaciens]
MGTDSAGRDRSAATQPRLSSDLGGPGWSPRPAAHHEEVAAGLLWARCGYRSECATLREVLLTRPPDSIASVTDPAAHLMTAPVDAGLLREQHAAVAEAYRRHGVSVHVLTPPPTADPNIIFARDLFLATPEGVVLARPASAQRAGEERYAAAALAALGVPLLRTMTGRAVFEGADALWVDDRTVLVGLGLRTNREGASVVRAVLREQGAEAVFVPLGPGVQHLLGSVVFVDHRRAVVHSAALGDELRAELLRRDYELLELPPDEEVVGRRAMNLVALGPGRVLMPDGCPVTRRRLEAAGLLVDAVDVSEYVKAAGALGCLTGILRRGGPDGDGGGGTG